MLSDLSALPAWAWLCLVLGAITAAGLLGAVVDRRLARRRVMLPAEPEDPLRDQRLRLAAELHETVSHEVSAVLLHSAGARAVPGSGDPRVSDALDLITRASTSCMHELVRQREVLHGLGGSGSGPAGVTDLSAVQDLLSRARERGVHVEIRMTGTCGALDPSIGRTVYLVVADLLRHAEGGVEPQLHLDLTWAPRSLQVRMAVNGIDVHPRSPHADLLLADRARLLGGHLETRESRRGQVLTLTLPVQPRLALPHQADVTTAPSHQAH